MIVRILGEGQFNIDEAATAELNKLDTQLEAAVERNDETAFTAALSIVASTRGRGIWGNVCASSVRSCSIARASSSVSIRHRYLT